MKPINVVEVMEFDADEAASYRRDYLGVSERAADSHAADSHAAKTAICALIEAARVAASLLERVAPYNPQTAALRDALAACRGGDQ